jgi:ribonuclease P protein component
MGEQAHVSAEQPTPRQAARLPSPDVDPRRPRGLEGSAGQGSPPALGLTWRIRDRRDFARFRTDARRCHAGLLWCSFRPDADAVPPRVAYAIGRAVGPAVVRNRVRRRLRALVTKEAKRGLPPGWYLFGARTAAATAPAGELEADARALADEIRALAP